MIPGWPYIVRLASMLRPTDVTETWSPDDCEEVDHHACRAERRDADEQIADFERVDLEDAAATARYRPKKGSKKPGRFKRTRYPRVDLSTRRVVISLHQTGVERTESRWRASAHRVTCHRFIGPTGTRYKVHPLDVRLIATNRLDRSPFHCIAIEIGGNFERVDGTGTWWMPDRYGYGRATDAQLEATKAEISSLVDEVREDFDAEVEAIVPHIIAGRDRDGRPNRQACSGSRPWSQAGEWAGADLGLAVPAEGFSIGGAPVPPVWHGPFWPRCDRFFTG